jgi:hypothetical protein
VVSKTFDLSISILSFKQKFLSNKSLENTGKKYSEYANMVYTDCSRSSEQSLYVWMSNLKGPLGKVQKSSVDESDSRGENDAA